jgi:hypothetical protein
MSENAPSEKTFQQRCDEFIDLANQQHAETDLANVNTALLFSAARFAVFGTVRQFENIEQIKQEQNQITDFFVQRFKEMVDQNFEEYVERFDEYQPK